MAKTKKKNHAEHCKEISADRERAAFLACSIYPGDGYVVSEDADIAGMLLELLGIVNKYDDADDREFIIFGIGEAVYPNTFEGQEVIDQFITRKVQSIARVGGTQ